MALLTLVESLACTCSRFLYNYLHLVTVTGKGFYSMTGKVVEEFGVFTVEVSYCKKVGIKDRRQKGNELMGKGEKVEQGVK